MANINSTEQANMVATPSVRTSNGKNGTLHYADDYVVTTSAISATGDTVTFQAGLVPNGATIDLTQSKLYTGAFGTGVVLNLGDSGSATRFASSGDVSAATSLNFGGTADTAAGIGALKATGGGFYTVTSEGYQITGVFKTSAPATGIGIGIRVAYRF